MSIFDSIYRKIHNLKSTAAVTQEDVYEFCPRCDANLTLQKGFSNDTPYWICKGCGEMLINPLVDSDIAWICDECEAMLNIQDGFTEDCGEWECKECGFVNKIDEANLYLSDEEYKAEMSSPYKGLSDDDIISLMEYEEVDDVPGCENITLVRDVVGKLYVRKFLKTYDKSIYEYLIEHPIKNMPAVVKICESENCLIVIEQYIEGKTLEQILKLRKLASNEAVDIMIKLAYITKELHSQKMPLIHRDIKPSNIIINASGGLTLLDMNAAKWVKENESQDTILLGTKYYAAPEQFGYGLSSSTEKTDIYALGVLLNVMLTGKMPQDEKATGELWNIIEKCISLNPNERYSDEELIDTLCRIVG